MRIISASAVEQGFSDLIDGRCNDGVDEGRIDEDFVCLDLFPNMTSNHHVCSFRLLSTAPIQLNGRIVLHRCCRRDVDHGVSEEDLTSSGIDLGSSFERRLDCHSNLDFVGDFQVQSRILSSFIDRAGDGLREGLDNDELGSVHGLVCSFNFHLSFHCDLGEGPRD